MVFVKLSGKIQVCRMQTRRWRMRAPMQLQLNRAVPSPAGSRQAVGCGSIPPAAAAVKMGVARMRGSLVEWVLVIAGLLGLVGLANSDFQPSRGLLVSAGVIAVTLAFCAVRAQPRPQEVYSPLQGRRRKARSLYSPLWVVFPLALVAGWLFTVYAAGMTLAAVAGVAHSRTGTVVYSAKYKPSARSWRPTCTMLVVVLKTERGPIPIHHCDAKLGGSTIKGMDVTFRTRESALGLFIDGGPVIPQLDAALEMARRAEEQAARAEGHR